jgi:hypothetical protein
VSTEFWIILIVGTIPIIIAEFMLHLADRDARRRAQTNTSGK